MADVIPDVIPDVISDGNVPLYQFALLLVAYWFECWCASLVAQVPFLACLVQFYKGEPDHAAATHHTFMFTMLISFPVQEPEC